MAHYALETNGLTVCRTAQSMKDGSALLIGPRYVVRLKPHTMTYDRMKKLICLKIGTISISCSQGKWNFHFKKRRVIVHSFDRMDAWNAIRLRLQRTDSHWNQGGEGPVRVH